MKFTKSIEVLGNNIPVEIEVSASDLWLFLNNEQNVATLNFLHNEMMKDSLKQQVETYLESQGMTSEAEDSEYTRKIAEMWLYELEHEDGQGGYTHRINLLQSVLEDNPLRKKHRYTVVLTKTVYTEVEVECYEDEEDDLEQLACDELSRYAVWDDYDDVLNMEDYTDEGEVDE